MRDFNKMSWDERKEIINKTKDELIPTIDYKPLYKELREILNDDSIQFYNHLYVNNRNEKYIEIQSEELIDKIGMMGAALKSVKLETFNTNIVFDEKTLKAYWWGSIDFSYEIADGGSNGMHILYFDYKDGKYTFRRVK